MKEVPIRNRHGKIVSIAKVSDNDFEEISNYNWFLCNNYAYCIVGYKNNGHTAETLSMHRLITDCPKNLEVDHINHNKLDNRRDNLRVVTRSENLKNRKNRIEPKTSKDYSKKKVRRMHPYGKTNIFKNI